MAAEKFTYGNTILTFATSGHSIKDRTTVVFNQQQATTISGVRMVDSLGSDYNRFDYTVVAPISSGSETDWADILEFIDSDHINGGVNSFVWTDKDSVETTVRLISSSVSMDNLGNNKCRVKFLLEEVN